MKKVLYVAMAVCMFTTVGCKNGNKKASEAVQEGADAAIEAVEKAAGEAVEAASEEGGKVRDLALEALDEIKSDAEAKGEAALAEFEGAVPFASVEQKPSFNGGDANSFSKWVASHLNYPQKAQEAGKEGRVILGFVVDENGQVTNVKVLRSVDPDLDAEAVRVVSSSPKWEAGQQNGQAAKVSYTFPVIFKLN